MKTKTVFNVQYLMLVICINNIAAHTCPLLPQNRTKTIQQIPFPPFHLEEISKQ